jgi:hypothetical protein
LRDSVSSSARSASRERRAGIAVTRARVALPLEIDALDSSHRRSFVLSTCSMVGFLHCLRPMENPSPSGFLAPLHAIVARTNEVAKSFGRRAAFHELQHRIVNRLVPFQVLKGMTATAAGIDPTLLDAGDLQTRFVTRDELLAAASVAEVAEEMSAEFIDQAIGRGDECFGIFDGQDLVSFGWYSNQSTQISDSLTLCFDRAWMYMYKGYTLRAYRGKRLHGIGMSQALYAYTKRGSRGLISYVRSTNFQSLRSTERMGYQIFGEIYIAEAVGRPLTWATPGCAHYDFRVERRS